MPDLSQSKAETKKQQKIKKITGAPLHFGASRGSGKRLGAFAPFPLLLGQLIPKKNSDYCFYVCPCWARSGCYLNEP